MLWRRLVLRTALFIIFFASTNDVLPAMTISVRDNWVTPFEQLPRSALNAHKIISEHHLVLNVVHMLMGVETDLFRVFVKPDQVTVVADVAALSARRSSHMSQGVIRNILKGFASIGTIIHSVRAFSKNRSGFTNDFLATRAAHNIGEFDVRLQSIVSGETDIHSLIHLRENVNERIEKPKALYKFAKLVNNIEQEQLLHVLQVAYITGIDEYSMGLIRDFLRDIDDGVSNAISGKCTPEFVHDIVEITGKVDEWKIVKEALLHAKHCDSLTPHRNREKDSPSEILLQPFADFGMMHYAGSASRHRLQVYLDETNFIEIAELINKVLFTTQSDFIVSFLSQAEKELSQPRDRVILQRVQDSSDVALQVSSEISKYPTNLVNQFRIFLANEGATGWDALRLRVSSPLISVEILRQVNRIHKYLLRLRKVEWDLACVFSDIKAAGDVPKELFALRAFMATSVQDSLRKVFHDIIDRHWTVFRSTNHRSISHLDQSYAEYIAQVGKAVRNLHDSMVVPLELIEKFITAIDLEPMNKGRAVGFILAFQNKHK